VRPSRVEKPQPPSRLSFPNRRQSSAEPAASGYTSYMAPQLSICLIALGAGASTFGLSVASFVGKDSGIAFATSTSSSFDSWITFRTLREQFETANDP